MSEFDPHGIGAPRIEHAVVDEETQTMRYLAEIAMADIEMLPPESNRRVRPGSLLAQYKVDVAERRALEAQNDVALVKETVGEPAGGEALRALQVADEVLRESPEPPAGPRFGKYRVAEFVGRKE